MEQVTTHVNNYINNSIFSYDDWDVALKQIALMQNSNHVHLLLFNKNQEIIDGLVASNLYDYQDSVNANIDYLHYQDKDERKQRLSILDGTKAFNNEEVFNEDELKTSIFYNEFLPKHFAQCQGFMSLNGPNETKIVYTVIREKQKGPFDSTSLKQISSFGPLIQNSITAQYELKLAGVKNRSLMDLLDQKNIGIVYLNEKGVILETNDYAQTILDKKDGLDDQGGYLSTLIHSEQNKLSRKLKSVLSDNTSQVDISPQIYISRLGGKKPYKLTITPILTKTVCFGDCHPAVMIIIKLPQTVNEFPELVFKEHYGLTKAELLLTEAIFNDMTLKEYAKTRNIKITTVRWTLDNIFSKTNTHSQKELKSLVLLFSG